jgi:hypothetical protein
LQAIGRSCRLAVPFDGCFDAISFVADDDFVCYGYYINLPSEFIILPEWTIGSHGVDTPISAK